MSADLTPEVLERLDREISEVRGATGGTINYEILRALVATARENQGLLAEVKALRRRMRVVEMGTMPVVHRVDGVLVWTLDWLRGIADDLDEPLHVLCCHRDPGHWPSASAALDAAADALEVAGILEVEP